MSNPLTGQIERLQSALQALAPRERVLVVTAAVFVACTALYLLAWEPLVIAHTQRAEALDRARALSARIEDIAVRAQGAGTNRRVDRTTSLLAAVDQTSRSPTLGKAPSRLQPEGEREVKIWIEDVAFENLLRWLQQLETQYGISASSAEIERGGATGVVSVRLTLTRG